ncbi:hypothetical protein F2P81_001247 [Scophthalmus maximus]|uniref:Uncharacterized protein n=1 Tax=Scophthalmus maximus TaxID=52904 RepID=A0A6A4TWS3_SCOMX|nr:hypothetical protein F2P81_001247 [Scophthalmus maximus]
MAYVCSDKIRKVTRCLTDSKWHASLDTGSTPRSETTCYSKVVFLKVRAKTSKAEGSYHPDATFERTKSGPAESEDSNEVGVDMDKCALLVPQMQECVKCVVNVDVARKRQVAPSLGVALSHSGFVECLRRVLWPRPINYRRNKEAESEYSTTQRHTAPTQLRLRVSSVGHYTLENVFFPFKVNVLRKLTATKYNFAARVTRGSCGETDKI